MSRAVLELRSQRADLSKKAQAILTKADSEKRSITAEEQQEFDKIFADVDKLGTEIEEIERTEGARSRLAALDATLTRSAGRYDTNTPAPGATNGKATKKQDREKRREEKRTKNFQRAEWRRRQPEYRDAFASYLRGGFKEMGVREYRALQADADIVGGYLVPPIQFVNKLILFLKDMVFVRKLATVIPVANAQSLGAPSLDADPADSDWTPEIATGNEDSTMAVGRRDLTPHPIAKRLKVSNKLLRLAANTEGLVRDRLGYKFGITEEKAFLSGTGSQQPLGLFTASTMGIDTSRDISTGNTTTAITADGLMEAKYNLKSQYQLSATTAWLFSRTAVKSIRKLKDANGQYLWGPGLDGGQPDSILDTPFYMSEYVPNTFTTGLYVGIIGDMKFYWIADSLNFAIQRLDELYAETNQTGFIARREVDGMPVLAEAFSRVKLA